MGFDTIFNRSRCLSREVIAAKLAASSTQP
jgi:hypothetical protein